VNRAPERSPRLGNQKNSAMRFSVVASCLGTAAALQVATNTTFNDAEVEDLEGGNLCMMGRLAPKFFLLGTPKSGTTFFFEDFARSKQIVSYQPSDDEPTWHSKEPWVFAGRFEPSARKTEWLSHYPKCSQDKHMVAVDCTPGYFGSLYAPFGIEKAYRDSRHTLVFMVFLREPVERTHSHYYQYEENGVLQGYFDECTPQQFPKTFAHAVHTRITTGSMCNCGCDNIFEDSMYVDSFKRYFKNFQSSSFHVVPFKQAVLTEVVDYAWKLLNVAKGTGEKGNLVGGDNQKNHHEYPTLHHEMDATLLYQFEDFMYKAAGPKAVSKVLVDSGAQLYGFTGTKSAPAIADWLAENW